MACYFGCDIRAARGVPVGLVHSAWSGACAESWLPADRLALWYQGENNILAVDEYRTLFPFLIREWRRMWGQGGVPFLFVRIAGFGAPPDQPEDSLWAHLREAQTAGLSEPRTGMVTAIDIGGDFHPRNKRDVGLRLSSLARVRVYGEGGRLATGPGLRGVRFDGPRAVVTFDDAGGGLRLRDGDVLEGFSVAGADRRFVWANARIEGDTVVVWSDAVPAPASVRYAWATNPRANLVNSEGLPAFPFRTDDWPPTQGL